MCVCVLYEYCVYLVYIARPPRIVVRTDPNVVCAMVVKLVRHYIYTHTHIFPSSADVKRLRRTCTAYAVHTYVHTELKANYRLCEVIYVFRNDSVSRSRSAIHTYFVAEEVGSDNFALHVSRLLIAFRRNRGPAEFSENMRSGEPCRGDNSSTGPFNCHDDRYTTPGVSAQSREIDYSGARCWEDNPARTHIRFAQLTESESPTKLATPSTPIWSRYCSFLLQIK